jgi:hypothetical protein
VRALHNEGHEEHEGSTKRNFAFRAEGAREFVSFVPFLVVFVVNAMQRPARAFPYSGDRSSGLQSTPGNRKP